MPLSHFLYRCPFCGHDPVREGRGEAHCAGCDRSFRPGQGKGTIHVNHPAGEAFEVDASVLKNRLEAILGAERPGRSGGEGDASGKVASSPVLRSSEVTMRVAREEEPLYRNGKLLGFVEQSGPKSQGKLAIDPYHLTFRGRNGDAHEWPVLDIRAVQGSSSTVQISPPEGGVVTFRFSSDSPRRWEDLLRRVIRDAWGEAGRGKVTEYQPRIRAERE
jgi:hypothetical protein